MSDSLGGKDRPLRIAIVGSGPSAFYSADVLFKSEVNICVNMFDRIFAPFGLVRYGVAPDHPKIKTVTKVYEKIASHPNYHFFGNVEVGKDITIHQLRKFHDAVIFAYGASSDRKLGIVGESSLKGIHTATEFVAWYNGHPDYKDYKFDLSGNSAVIIGQGNVALDVARVLCKTVDELKHTDITEYALDTLAESKIKNVHIIGRRGPAQSAFTPSEISEFESLEDCVPVIDSKELELNEASQKELEDPKNRQKQKNFEILKRLANITDTSKSKKAYIQFRKSPSAIYGTDSGQVDRIYLEKNKLFGEENHQKSMGTGIKETLECSILFRSVGYRGLPIEGLAFNGNWGVVANVEGRVSDSEHVSTGLYAVGWIKRGPSGIIGSNKPDAQETVKHLLSDIDLLIPGKNPSNAMLVDFFKERNIRYVSYDDWKKLDAEELRRGESCGKPRVKFCDTEEALNFL